MCSGYGILKCKILAKTTSRPNLKRCNISVDDDCHRLPMINVYVNKINQLSFFNSEQHDAFLV